MSSRFIEYILASLGKANGLTTTYQSISPYRHIDTQFLVKYEDYQCIANWYSICSIFDINTLITLYVIKEGAYLVGVMFRIFNSTHRININKHRCVLRSIKLQRFY